MQTPRVQRGGQDLIIHFGNKHGPVDGDASHLSMVEGHKMYDEVKESEIVDVRGYEVDRPLCDSAMVLGRAAYSRYMDAENVRLAAQEEAAKEAAKEFAAKQAAADAAMAALLLEEGESLQVDTKKKRKGKARAEAQMPPPAQPQAQPMVSSRGGRGGRGRGGRGRGGRAPVELPSNVTIWQSSSVVTEITKQGEEVKTFVFWQDPSSCTADIIAAVDVDSQKSWLVQHSALVSLRTWKQMPLMLREAASAEGRFAEPERDLDNYPGPYTFQLKHHDDASRAHSRSKENGGTVTSTPAANYWRMWISASFHDYGKGWEWDLSDKKGEKSPCKVHKGRLMNWGLYSKTWQPLLNMKEALSKKGVEFVASTEFGAAMAEAQGMPIPSEIGIAQRVAEADWDSESHGASDAVAAELMAGRDRPITSVDALPELLRMMLSQILGDTVDFKGVNGPMSLGFGRDKCMNCREEALPSKPLLACRGCFGTQSFCSKQCQKAAWNTHKACCKEHAENIRGALDKIISAPTFPKCRHWPPGGGFRGPSRSSLVVDAIMSRTTASWVEGLTLREVMAVAAASPKEICSVLRKAG